MIEIILISPRNTDISFQDAPTVAEAFLPTEKTSPEPVYKTYGELWIASMSREERTSFYLAM